MKGLTKRSGATLPYELRIQTFLSNILPIYTVQNVHFCTFNSRDLLDCRGGDTIPNR